MLPKLKQWCVAIGPGDILLGRLCMSEQPFICEVSSRSNTATFKPQDGIELILKQKKTPKIEKCDKIKSVSYANLLDFKEILRFLI